MDTTESPTATPGCPAQTAASSMPIAMPSTVPIDRCKALIAVSPRELVLLKTRKAVSTDQNHLSRDNIRPQTMAMPVAIVICSATRIAGSESDGFGHFNIVGAGSGEA